MTVITIDGSAASGKGTLARRLAKHFGFAYLDTGLLYRAIGYLTLSLWTEHTDFSEEMINSVASSITPSLLQNVALRDEKVTKRASILASIPKVRAALILQQQNFAKNPPDNASGAILDGRDIGSVILPDADVKLYIDADINVRAKRRFLELSAKDETITQAQILADLT